MTAAEWDTSTNPEDMLSALDDAKFSTARIPVVLAGFAERRRFVDLLSPDLRPQFRKYAQWVFGLSPRPLPIELPVFDPLAPQEMDSWDVEQGVRDYLARNVGEWWAFTWVFLAEAYGERRVHHFDPPTSPADPVWQRRQADALRDTLGNPFAPVAWEPGWRSETVVALATGIHFDNAFDRLPILADALEEAGCDEQPMLDHLRGPGPHARGCWVLDLILNREPELFAHSPLVPSPRRMKLGPFTPPAEGMA